MAFSDKWKKAFRRNVKPTLDKTRKGFQNALLKIESGADNFSDENIIKQEVAELLSMFPDSPKFLGKTVKYPKIKKRLFIFNKKLPDLRDLRDSVSQPIEKLELETPRKKILKLLKSHRFFPDVHALHAIQVYNDTIRASNDIKKTAIIKGSLVEISKAIINGGASVFNVTWAVKIYLNFLDLLNENYTREYKATVNHYLQSIRLHSNELHKNQIRIQTLMTVRDKLEGLTLLNQRLKGTPFFKENISLSDIRGACNAILQENEEKEIAYGKNAKNIIWVLLTYLILFAKIPIFKSYVNQTLNTIPDMTRDFVLQKFMVKSMEILTEFRLGYAVGDREKAKFLASALFKRCTELIEQYLEYTILSKPYEVEPFLKAAWIAKEGNGLFPEKEYRSIVDKSLGYLNSILKRSKKLKRMNEQALILQNHLNNIKLEYGWSL